MWHPSYYLIIMREFHRLMSRIVRVCSTQHVSISGENFLVSSVIFEQFNRWLIITRNSYVNNESDTRSNRLNNTSVPYLLLNTFISHLKLIQIEISIPFVFFLSVSWRFYKFLEIPLYSPNNINVFVRIAFAHMWIYDELASEIQWFFY